MSTEGKKNIIKTAMLCVQEGKWDKAIVEYKKLLALDPIDYNVHSMLGDAYIKKGEDAFAYQEYMFIVEQYKRQGLTDKTAAVMKKIARLDIEKLNAIDRKKVMLVKIGVEAEKTIEDKEYEKGITLYNEILAINPEEVDALGKLGEIYVLLGNKEEALVYFSKLIDILYRVHLYKKVLPVLRRVIELTPEDISIHEKLADIYEKEEMEEAKREYLFLAEYYYNKKNVEKTYDYGKKAVEAKSIDGHFFYGWALLEKNQREEAKREFETLLKFKVTHINALIALSTIQREMGLLDDALISLNKILKEDNDNAVAQKGIGDVYFAQGIKREAIAKYMVAVEVHLKKKEMHEAESLCEMILAKEPENAEFIKKMAEIYASQDMKTKAVENYILLAEIYKKDNNFKKEKESYKFVEELSPEHPKLKRWKQERPQEISAPVSIPEVKKNEPVKEEKKVEEKKENIFDLLALAEKHIKAGELDKAVEVYQRAVTLAPENTEAKIKLEQIKGAQIKGDNPPPTPDKKKPSKISYI